MAFTTPPYAWRRRNWTAGLCSSIPERRASPGSIIGKYSKRTLMATRKSSTIITPMIEKLIAVALRQGALAAKVCGAGGGGCVVFLTEPENREHISAAIRSYGGHVLPAMVARD